MDVVTAAKLWLAIRPIRRLKERKLAAKGKAATRQAVQAEAEEDVKAFKGGLKSKLVWLGIAQLAYSLVELWLNGTLTSESAATAVSGALTIVFRAMTTKPLADKAAPPK